MRRAMTAKIWIGNRFVDKKREQNQRDKRSPGEWETKRSVSKYSSKRFILINHYI